MPSADASVISKNRFGSFNAIWRRAPEAHIRRRHQPARRERALRYRCHRTEKIIALSDNKQNRADGPATQPCDRGFEAAPTTTTNDWSAARGDGNSSSVGIVAGAEGTR